MRSPIARRAPARPRRLLACLLAVAACSPDVAVVDGRRQGDAAFVASGLELAGLRQEVRLAPAEPRPGDTLHIRSVIRNVSGETRYPTARICGLDLRGSLELRDPYFRCAAYSSDGNPLAPGDSLVSADGGIVLSSRGVHRLEVRHLLEPEAWVRLTVVVR